MDTRLIVYAVWAAAMLVVWGLVVVRDYRAYRTDRRNVLADLLSDIASFVSAVAAAISLVVLIIGQDVPGLRGFALALFLGGFLGAGIVKLTLGRRVRVPRARRS